MEKRGSDARTSGSPAHEKEAEFAKKKEEDKSASTKRRVENLAAAAAKRKEDEATRMEENENVQSVAIKQNEEEDKASITKRRVEELAAAAAKRKEETEKSAAAEKATAEKAPAAANATPVKRKEENTAAGKQEQYLLLLPVVKSVLNTVVDTVVNAGGHSAASAAGKATPGTKPARIMMLTNRIGQFAGNTGGGSAMREKLCSALQRQGYVMRMFAAGQHPSADVGHTDYSPMLLPTLRSLVAMHAMLREVDLLIVSGSFTACMPSAVLIARLLRVRSLVIFTTDSDKVVEAYYTGVQRAVWWQLYSWCDRLVAALATRVYTRSAEFLEKLDRMHSIRCLGVMSQQDQYSSFSVGQHADSEEKVAAARSLLSAGQPEKPLLLYCGRWAPEKRIDLVARNKPKGSVLAIVGNGDSAGGAEAVAALHDPQNGVVCLREFVKHDTLRVYYKAADVHVSASDFETLGNSCHEALLCGTPVVLERAGGYLSQVDDGQQGFLVHWANATEAAEAVTKALALKNKVAPRKRDTTEGSDIVRAMLATPPPQVLPQSAAGYVGLLTWSLRAPVLLALLGVYVNSPRYWPQEVGVVRGEGLIHKFRKASYPSGEGLVHEDEQ